MPRQVKNTVMQAKCDKTPDECKDANCPVHGKPEEPEDQSADETTNETAGADGAMQEAPESQPVDLQRVLLDAKDVIEHINHQNEFTRDLVNRIDAALAQQ